MAYFVTGATGFIGRFLLAQLLEREGTIYALCRSGSLDKLDDLKARLGADDDRIVPIVGDLSRERLGVSRRRTSSASTARSSTSSTSRRSTTSPPTPTASSWPTSRARGTPCTWPAPCTPGTSTWSARSRRPGSTRARSPRTCSTRPQDVEHNPYYHTKHEAERVVRERVPGAVAGLPSGRGGRALRDRRDRQDRRPVLLLQDPAAAARRHAVVGAGHRHRGRRDQPRPRRLRRQGDGPHRPPARPRRPGLPPHRPRAAHRRRAVQGADEGGQGAAADAQPRRPRPGRRCRPA